jgi:hypothetical protein
MSRQIPKTYLRRAEEFGRLFAFQNFIETLAPKNRGKDFDWGTFVVDTGECAKRFASFEFSLSALEQWPELLGAVKDGAEDEVRAILAKSRILDWWPYPLTPVGAKPGHHPKCDIDSCQGGCFDVYYEEYEEEYVEKDGGAEEPKSESKDIQTRAAAADLLARTMAMKGFYLNPGNREDWHCQFGLEEDLVVSMTLAAKYGDSPAEWHILFRDWDPGKGVWRWKAASPLRFANPVAAATYALRHILPQCG